VKYSRLKKILQKKKKYGIIKSSISKNNTYQEEIV
jgi:hypothetical protein